MCAYAHDKRIEGKIHNNFFVGADLSTLSKSFDCILHDLLIAKLSKWFALISLFLFEGSQAMCSNKW